jgi:hypothetical protein
MGKGERGLGTAWSRGEYGVDSGVLLKKIEVVIYALPPTKLKVSIRPCSHVLNSGGGYIRHFKNWLVSIYIYGVYPRIPLKTAPGLRN